MKLNYGEFDDLKNDTIKFAKNLLVKDKGHIPIVLAITKQGTIPLDISAMLDSASAVDDVNDTTAYHHAKDLIAKAVAQFIQTNNSYAYMYISECWYVKRKDGNYADIETRHMEDKEEALTISWEYDAYNIYKTGMTIIPFYRDEDGSILILKEVDKEYDASADSPKYSGRFTSLLRVSA
ncbi:hypothetical protein CMI47_16555 [Candidatus Pacearchaeota archaeon]|jgi:hypothetical protein|nr:hypothetical protein [Candidatus Pacearchaeota archaeon]|tara:strand:- start:5604 stop:6143 length:540 start_codon:yes stop_codon:yes gene_type:complete